MNDFGIITSPVISPGDDAYLVTHAQTDGEQHSFGPFPTEEMARKWSVDYLAVMPCKCAVTFNVMIAVCAMAIISPAMIPDGDAIRRERDMLN